MIVGLSELIIKCRVCGKQYSCDEGLDFLCSCGHLAVSGIPIKKSRTYRKNPQYHKADDKQSESKKVSDNIITIDKDIRTLDQNSIILTNKEVFLIDKCCPKCGKKTVKEYVRIVSRPSVIGRYLSDCPLIYIYGNVRTCEKCCQTYVTVEQLDRFNAKAYKKSIPYQKVKFLRPANLDVEVFDSKTLYIPKSLIDSERKTPPKLCDMYYDLSDEEKEWIVGFYRAETSDVPLRKRSIISEEGYSAYLELETRRNILERCVKLYGKGRVLHILNYLVTSRINQKNGEDKYRSALYIWQSDIDYVKEKYGQEM